MDHVVVNARDVERALEFYGSVIGLEGERVEEWRRGEVLFPSVRLNADTLIDIFPPELWRAHQSSSDASDEARAGVKSNFDHFCMCVDAREWDGLRERIAEAHVPVEMEPTTLWGAHGEGTSMYLRDTDGNRVEVRYYP
jgi:extradiol dioxygenase family protein